MMVHTTIVVAHSSRERAAKLRVRLRSSHGSSRTTRRKSVGTTIVAISSMLIVNGPRWISGGTIASRPNSDKKYHAGYGTKNFVGSAFSSRYGGNANARKQMMTKTINENAPSMKN